MFALIFVTKKLAHEALVNVGFEVVITVCSLFSTYLRLNANGG
jgi:hypothetical protein